MVAWWPGDGNTRDIRGGNNGVLQNGATFAPGNVGQAFSFSGSSNEVVFIPDSQALAITGSLTINAWIKLSALPSGLGQILFRGDDRGNLDPYTLTISSSGNAYFHIEDASSASANVTSPSPMPVGVFTHVAGTLDAGTGLMTLYVNGAVAAQTTTSIRPFGTLTGAHPGLGIGNIQNPPAFSEPFPGLIDEVEVFSRALSQSEIQAIVNAGGGGSCAPPQPTSAVSRKTHTGAGSFDIDLNPNGIAGVECRNATSYQMVVQFANPVTISGATILSGAGTVSSTSVSGNTVTVNLAGVTNAQTVVVSLTNVSDGTLSGNVPVAMGVLVGDTNGDRSVNSGDSLQTRNRSGQATDATNFRSDVNTDGFVNSGDTTVVRSRSGTFLP